MNKADSSPELMVVMPVYNEQASLKKVVIQWMEELENWSENFILLAINDGSSDDSLKVLQKLKLRFGEHLEIINRDNQGHGPSCLFGYHQAALRDIPWIFQLDSDGQCHPEYFYRLWRNRNKYDVLYGVRTQREDGINRFMVSMILRLFLLVFFQVWCLDANVPYRLIRTSTITSYLSIIPSNFFLANVALAVLLRKNPSVRHYYIPIRFKERYGGEPSIKLFLFSKKAKELYQELKLLTKKL